MPAWLKPEDEVWWEKAKQIAKDSGFENNFQYITGLFKKMKREKKDDKLEKANRKILSTIVEYNSTKDLYKKSELIETLSTQFLELKNLGKLNFATYMDSNNSECLMQVYMNLMNNVGNEFPEVMSNIKENISELVLEDGDYIVDKYFNSPRLFVTKKDDYIKINSIFGEDYTDNFDWEIMSDLKKEKRDYSLTCQITYMVLKQRANNSQIKEDILNEKFVDSTKKSQVIFNVIDSIYFGKDLSKQNLKERKKLLKTMTCSHHLKLAPFIYAENQNQLPKAVELASKLIWSEGAIVSNTNQLLDKKQETTNILYKK